MLKKKILLVGFIAMNVATSTFATGVVAGATEITQILNNAQLMMQVAESTKAAVELEMQTAMQIKQLWHDAQNLKNLGESFVDGNTVYPGTESAFALKIG